MMHFLWLSHRFGCRTDGNRRRKFHRPCTPADRGAPSRRSGWYCVRICRRAPAHRCAVLSYAPPGTLALFSSHAHGGRTWSRYSASLRCGFWRKGKWPGSRHYSRPVAGTHLRRHLSSRAYSNPGFAVENARWLPWLAFPIGVESGFSSAGAGALGTVLLLNYSEMTPAQVVGTDIVFGLVLATIGSAVHWSFGSISTPILLQLLAGGVPGVGLAAYSLAECRRRN